MSDPAAPDPSPRRSAKGGFFVAGVIVLALAPLVGVAAEALIYDSEGLLTGIIGYVGGWVLAVIGAGLLIIAGMIALAEAHPDKPGRR